MKRVLVIDDDFLCRAVLRQALEHEGYEVVEASDGAAGVRLYQETPVDLVITDIIMPEREGLEVIQTFRQLCATLKIMAISGGSHRLPGNFLPAAARLGAQRVLAKPIRRPELLDAVHALLDDSPATP